MSEPKILSDGTVVPSFVSLISDEDRRTRTDNQIWNNYALRVGYIVGESLQETNKAKGSFAEYDVLVPQVDGRGAESFSLYKNCRMLIPFGAVSDTVSATFRSIQNVETLPSEEELAQTTKVLVLCANGRTDAPYIIGAAQHPLSQGQTKEDGHHFRFVFNGVTLLIDKDGSPSLSFKGATKADGELTDEADPEASGTKLSITKEGNFLITTNPEGEKPQSILVDHQNKRMELSANTGYSVTVQDGPALISAKQDVLLDSDAQVGITAANDVTIKSEGGNVNIAGNAPPGFGVILGSGSDAMLKGTTYRTQESLANQNVAAMLQAASVALAAAGVACAVPIVGPVTASPLIATASTLLASASAAIQAFEAQSVTYLSLKNKND